VLSAEWVGGVVVYGEKQSGQRGRKVLGKYITDGDVVSVTSRGDKVVVALSSHEKWNIAMYKIV